jgi:hypothetical protein
MRVALEKKKSHTFRIEKGIRGDVIAIDAANLASMSDGMLSVSFKYYARSFECLSAWQKEDLKGLSAWFERMAKQTPAAVKSAPTCHKHMGASKRQVPRGLSPDISIYGLRVGQKQRVHGAFVQDNFFVIWLDRNHGFHS